MWKNKKIACIIPARLASSRFPRKILALLNGKPLIEWVWDAAKKVPLFDEVALAIDAEETARVVEKFGGTYYFTSEGCQSGTDRLIELQKKGLVKADIWVNWQVDGPFISEKTIKDLLQTCDDVRADLWTLKRKLADEKEIESPDVPKVVTDKEGYALYFSRCPIPYHRKVRDGQRPLYYKHIGLYAYSDRGLGQIGAFSPCDLEYNEQLEQLRFLYNGLRIKVHETQEDTLEIDLPEHLEKAARLLV